jgi:ribosomal protein L11 methyltransferase
MQNLNAKSGCFVANILAAPLMALAPEFATLLKSEGEFALAGVIEEQVADVSSVYSEFFDILEIEKREENWCRISGNAKTINNTSMSEKQTRCPKC